jgi:uncharacterized protein (DUF697 family)
VPSAVPWNLCNEILDRVQRGEFDHAGEEAKGRAVTELISSCSSAAAVLALQPFTGVDTALVTPLHYRMVAGIARIRGYALEARAPYEEILGRLRGKIFAHHLGMMAVKFIPFTNLLAVPVAYGLTCAIGGVSSEYYERGRTMGAKEMKQRFNAIYKKAHEQAFREKRNEFRTMFRNPTIRRQIGELKKARHEGTASAEEVERRIDEILTEDAARAARGRP